MGTLFDRAARGFERARVSVQGIFETYAGAVVLAVIAVIGFGLMAGAEYWGGQSERIPITSLYIGSWLLMFILPVMLVWSHRRRQHHVISKVRSLYAVAVEYLMTGREQEAQQALRSVRKLEQHWRIGNSLLYRLVYSAFVIGATTLVAVLHYVFLVNVYSQSGYGQAAHKNLADTMHYLVEHPLQLWWIGGISLFFGFRAIEHLKDLAGAPWSEFYGDRLSAALKAGRVVNEAPWHDKPTPRESVSARELLGLPERFTRAQLRRAWLSLVRDLHPDRWESAGNGVRMMKEAALKRVNAARDELASQVAD